MTQFRYVATIVAQFRYVATIATQNGYVAPLRLKMGVLQLCATESICATFSDPKKFCCDFARPKKGCCDYYNSKSCLIVEFAISCNDDSTQAGYVSTMFDRRRKFTPISTEKSDILPRSVGKKLEQVLSIPNSDWSIRVSV